MTSNIFGCTRICVHAHTFIYLYTGRKSTYTCTICIHVQNKINNIKTLLVLNKLHVYTFIMLNCRGFIVARVNITAQGAVFRHAPARAPAPALRTVAGNAATAPPRASRTFRSVAAPLPPRGAPSTTRYRSLQVRSCWGRHRHVALRRRPPGVRGAGEGPRGREMLSPRPKRGLNPPCTRHI